MYAPASAKAVKAVGEFNTGRIRIKDNVVQHWVNGVKVVEATWGSQDWKDKIAASKFKAFEGFGAQPKGYIALQDHGNDVWFRNIRIPDLTGWTFFLEKGGKMEDVWSVKDGVLICKGNPIGYIRTEKDYKSYVLKVE